MPAAMYWAAVDRVRALSSSGFGAAGQGMQVDDTVVRVILLLQGDPLLERSDEVAEMERIVRGLHSREQDGLGHGVILLSPRREAIG